MDALTHVFLPLLVALVVRPRLFGKPRYQALGGFGLLADFDKLLGVPGLLHSLLTLVPLCLGLVILERFIRGQIHYSGLASLFVLSHLPLDIISGVPVPLLFPVVTVGVGFTYPLEVVFGVGPFGFTFQGWPIGLTVDRLRTGHASASVDTNTFGFINGFGVASLLALLTAVLSRVYMSLDNGAGE